MDSKFESKTATFTLLLFAGARDLLKRSSITVELPTPARVKDLVHMVLSQHPELKPFFGNALISLNLEYTSVDSEEVISPTDEIALIPPISGG